MFFLTTMVILLSKPATHRTLDMNHSIICSSMCITQQSCQVVKSFFGCLWLLVKVSHSEGVSPCRCFVCISLSLRFLFAIQDKRQQDWFVVLKGFRNCIEVFCTSCFQRKGFCQYFKSDFIYLNFLFCHFLMSKGFTECMKPVFMVKIYITDT